MRAFMNSVTNLLGSRLAMAVSGLFLVAFLGQALMVPGRIPPIGGLNLIQLGLVQQGDLPSATLKLPDELPPEVQAEIQSRATAALAAAQPKITDGVRSWIAAHPDQVRWVNVGGAILSALLLGVAMMLYARRGIKRDDW
jgi:hypothetical protein